MKRSRARRVLIIVQNLPVPLDRRVWLECQSLVAAGIGVSVICPKGPGDPHFSEIDGVRLYKYNPVPMTSGVASYVYEFLVSWVKTFGLSWRVFWRDGFSVIQTCNPPDTYFALAMFYKPMGVRFVFDQHDLCPEVYESRFARRSRILLAGLRFLERCTYRIADYVISTNESYRAVALGRGRQKPERVAVVRSGPDPNRLYPEEPDLSLRRNRRFLCCYLGVMGPQDDVDVILRMAEYLVNHEDRTDIHFALLGFGDALEGLRREAVSLGVEDYVEFIGRADDELIRKYLSSADIGIAPDRKTPLNDVSTHNKVMEYMACELPVLGFELHENMVSVEEAGVFVVPNDEHALAGALIELLDDPERREKLGRLGRERVVRELAWEHQETVYVSTIRAALSPG